MTPVWPKLLAVALEPIAVVGAGAGIVGLDCRSGVGHDKPVAVTVASIGSASPKTHLYLAPCGSSGSVRIVS